MKHFLSFGSNFIQKNSKRKLAGIIIGLVAGLPITLLFLISSSIKSTHAQSTNPWNLYNNPTYGNSLDASLGPSTVDPPPMRLHSNGNMMLRTNLILGQTQVINTQTWTSTARGIIFNSASTPWWIRQNASDTHLAFGSSTNTADNGINFSIDSSGNIYMPKAGSVLRFPEITAGTTYTGTGTANGNLADGMPYYGSFGREPGTWGGIPGPYPYPNYVLNNHTGLRLAAHGGYGGVAIYEQYPLSGGWAAATTKGNEVARFKDDRFGGSYFTGRLGLGSTATPVTALDVNGTLQLKTGGLDAGGASATAARIISTPNLHIDSQDGANSIYFNYWGGAGSTLFCDGSNTGTCNTAISPDGILTSQGNYGRLTTTHAAGYYDVNYPYQMYYYAGSEFMRSYMDGSWNYVVNTVYSPYTGNIVLLPKANVGIGTNNPNRKLEVGNGSDGITFGQVTDNTQTIQTYIDGHWADRASYAGACCNKLLLQPDVGEVGIGTTTPFGKLSVGFGNGDQLIVYQPGDDALAIQTTLNGQPNNGYGGHAPNRLILQPTTGRVGIKHSNPQSDLHIKQASNSQGDAGIRIERADTGGFGTVMYGGNDATHIFSNSNSVYCLLYTNATWGCASDRRQKENIKPLEGSALDIISNLKPSTFNWKVGGAHGAGFIAQDVLEVLPGAVGTSDVTGLYTVSDSYFTPYLVKGLQELDIKVNRASEISQESNDQIKALNETIQNQQQQIDELRQQIELLKK